RPSTATRVRYTTLFRSAVVKVTDKREFVVDVDGEGDLPIRDAPDPMGDAHLLALFYGNRAMELLLEDRLAEARLWLDAAFRQERSEEHTSELQSRENIV